MRPPRGLVVAVVALLLGGCIGIAPSEDAGRDPPDEDASATPPSPTVTLPPPPPPVPTTPTPEPPDATNATEPTVATVEDGKLLVAGEPFTVRGVTYAPSPPGWRGGLGWIHVPEIYEADLPLIRDMGANTLRLVTAPTDEASGKRFLDAAHAHGLYVIMGTAGPMRQNASDPAVQEATLAEVERVVTLWKDHPAVLMWVIGNEVNYMYGGTDVADWYRLLENATQLAKSIDPNHPVATANSGFQDAKKFVAHASSVDVFGMNHYNYQVGHYEWYLAEAARLVPGKAILVTEFGVDALDNRTGAEYEALQAEILVEHVRAIDGAPRAIGTLIFEWVDEWWKSGENDVHNAGGDWAPWGAEERLPDGHVSEEWFGIVRQKEGSYEREPREAYYALAAEWGGTATR